MVDQPELGWTTEAKVTRVIDADTVEVSITRKFPVRLIDPDYPDEYFNMPERRTPLGEKLRDYLVNLLVDLPVRLHIPAGKSAINFTDINSFNRIIGALWYNGKSVAQALRVELLRLTVVAKREALDLPRNSETNNQEEIND